MFFSVGIAAVGMIRFPQACCQIPSTSQFFRHRNPDHFFCDFTSSSSPTCGAVFKTQEFATGFAPHFSSYSEIDLK